MSDATWVWISMDAKAAKRQGMPARIPVPKAEFEGLADRGLSIENARRWTGSFLGELRDPTFKAEHAAEIAKLEVFLSKGELWQRARQAFEAKDYKRATSTLRMISNLDPDDHAARMNLGSTLANGGDAAGAQKHFDAVADTFEGELDFHLAYGNLKLALGDRDGAADQLSLALQADPSCKAAMDALVQLGVLVPLYESPRDASSLTYLRADALAAGVAEIWDEAPRDTAYYLEQLAYHEADGRAEVALGAAERAIALAGEGPVPPPDRAVLGRVAALRKLGRLDEALATADAFLGQNPRSVWGLVERARTRAARNEAEQAIVDLDAALALEPGDVGALRDRFLPATDDLAVLREARAGLAAFVASHPTGGGQRVLASFLQKIGSAEEARAAFDAGLAIAPDDDELRADAWRFLSAQGEAATIVAQAAGLGDLAKRHWTLRWAEAEALSATGKRMEAQAAFTALNADDTLSIDIRKRAKRAAQHTSN